MEETLRPTEKDLVPRFQCIVIRPGYVGGKPALLGKRISVAQIFEALSDGTRQQTSQPNRNFTRDPS